MNDIELRALWSQGAAKRHAWLSTCTPLMASSGKRFVTDWHESEYQVWLEGYRAARALTLEEIASWIATQRNDIPMTGNEAAAAIRTLLR